MELTHQEALSFNEISEKELPVGLKLELGKLNALIRKYEVEPTDELKNTVEKKSATLAHKIADYAEREKDYEPSGEESNTHNPDPANEQVEIIDGKTYYQDGGQTEKTQSNNDSGFFGGFFKAFGF